NGLGKLRDAEFVDFGILFSAHRSAVETATLQLDLIRKIGHRVPSGNRLRTEIAAIDTPEISGSRDDDTRLLKISVLNQILRLIRIRNAARRVGNRRREK